MSASHICSMLVALAMLLAVVPAQTPPPSSGEWTISDSTTISGQMVTLNGDLIIKSGGKLELDNVTLVMNCQNNGQYMILVEDAGELVLKNNTTVTCTNANFPYKFQVFGGFTATGSTIENVWGPSNPLDWREAGIYIRTDDAFMIDTCNIRSCVQTGITINGSNGTITGSTVTKNGNRGILCYGDAGPLISGCTISDNGWYGLSHTESSHARMTNNNIFDNPTAGMVIDNSTPRVDNNTISRINAARISYGIYNRGSSNATIENNTIEDCGIGIESIHGSRPYISCNIILRCEQYGISNNASSRPTIFKNYINDSAVYGIITRENANATILNNSINDPKTSGTVNIDNCYATVIGNRISGGQYGIYNDYSAKSNIIQNIIMDVTVCCIRSLDRTESYIFNNTIIMTNQTQVGISNEANSSARIEGNKISGGRCGIYGADYCVVNISSDNQIINSSDCGVWTYYGKSVNITNNTIENCSDGIYNEYSRCVRIDINDLLNNTFCGINNNNCGELTIGSNTILGNKWVGIYNADSSPVVKDNTISNNNFAGINNTGNSGPTISNNNISGNIHFGIVNLDTGRPVIENNTIAGHSMDGIFNDRRACVTIRNNTICGNSGAGIRNGQTIQNPAGNDSIIINNSITSNGYGIVNSGTVRALIRDNPNISLNRRDGIRNENNADVRIENNNISENKGDGIVGLDGTVLVVSENNISRNALNGIIGAGGCRLTIERNVFFKNYVNMAIYSRQGNISGNDITEGIYGIKLYNTSIPVAATSIFDEKQELKFGIFMSRSDSRITGLNAALTCDTAILFLCEARSSPRITNITAMMPKLDMVFIEASGDSHPLVVDPPVKDNRYAVVDNSSVIVHELHRLKVVDQKIVPLERATVTVGWPALCTLTTSADGYTDWQEFENKIILWAGEKKNTRVRKTPYEVTIWMEADRCDYPVRAFDSAANRIFVFDCRPEAGPVPKKTVFEDMWDSFNLTTYLYDPDNGTEQLRVFKIGESEDNPHVLVNESGLTLDIHYDRPVQTDMISLKVTDGNKSTEFDLIIHVRPVNDRPVYKGRTVWTAVEDEELVIDLGENSLSDEDNATSDLTISNVTNEYDDYYSSEGLILTLLYPDNFPDIITSDRVVVTVEDGSGGYCTVVLNIIVQPVNDPPEIIVIPAIRPIEDIEWEIDLSQYIYDIDNKSSDLTLIANSKYCTVDGFKLKFNYSEGVREENVSIIITDGIDYCIYKVKIKVKVVDDPPEFRPPPRGFEVFAGEKKTIDITDGRTIDDPDTPPDKIRIWSNSTFISFNGTRMTFNYPAGKSSWTDNITLTLYDGHNYVYYRNITVNISGRNGGGGVIEKYSIWIYVLLPFAVLVGAVAIQAYRRYKYGWYEFKRAFLVYQDGRMLAHYGDKGDCDDDMLVSSMLTAVQQFIEEAMKKDQAGPIQEFQYKDMKIAVEKGRRLFLAVILKGYTTGHLRKKMKELVANVESRYDKELKEWDGRMTKVPLIREAEAELEKLAGKGSAKKAPGARPG